MTELRLPILKLFTAYRMDCEDPNIRVIVSSLIDRLWLLAFEIRLLVIAFTGQCINYQVFLAFWFSEHGQVDQRASQEYRWIKAMNFPSLAFDTVRSFQIKISIISTRKNQSVIGEINMSDSGQEIFYSLSSYVRFQILLKLNRMYYLYSRENLPVGIFKGVPVQDGEKCTRDDPLSLSGLLYLRLRYQEPSKSIHFQVTVF